MNHNAINGKQVQGHIVGVQRLRGAGHGFAAHALGVLTALGLRGAAKKVGDAMEPAFNIYAGGSYALGKGVVAEQIGTITSKNLPAFFLALNDVLLKADQPYDEWYPAHQEELLTLINSFE